MLEKDDNSLFIAGTKFSHIIDTINGELVYGDADEYVKDGRVIVELPRLTSLRDMSRKMT